MTEHRLDRRQFIRQSATAHGAALVAPVAAAAAPPRRATDLVPLGRTGVRMARLGIGTGSSGGDIQRGLGQQAFTRLLRYAVERGVTYIDTADNYRIHDMVGVAIKGLPREQLFIQTKMPWTARRSRTSRARRSTATAASWASRTSTACCSTARSSRRGPTTCGA